jgi:hypothetical protein
MRDWRERLDENSAPKPPRLWAPPKAIRCFDSFFAARDVTDVAAQKKKNRDETLVRDL